MSSIRPVHYRLGLAYFAVAVAACTLSSLLTYQGPLASKPWTCWAGELGELAWIRDGLRALVAAALAFCALAQMDAFAAEGPRSWRAFSTIFPSPGAELRATILLTVLAIASVPLLGTDFKQGLPERCKGVPIGSEMREIWAPYVLYLPYIVILWIGIVFPILLYLWRWVSQDLRWRTEVAQELRVAFASLPESLQEKTRAFEHMRVAFEAYVLRLRETAERYVSVLVLVTIALLYEQTTASHRTGTDLAADIGKIALWLLLGPALFSFIVVVATGYQRTARRFEQVLTNIIGSLDRQGADAGLLDRMLKARGEIVWERSAAAFIVSVVKSATVAMPLLFALGGYVVSLLADDKSLWVHIFVPKRISDFFKLLYS